MSLNYITIDFETANHYRNSACSVGLVRFEDGKEVDSCHSLIHPAKMYFILEWTEDIHHISYGDVRDMPYFPEVWDAMVMPFIGQTPDFPLVAHNGKNFDMQVIRSCCEYFGIEYLAHDALEDSRTCGLIVKLAADKWGVDNMNELVQACGMEFCCL